MHQIFISYAPCDQEFTVQLASALRANGAPVWLDVQNAEPGRHWTRSIEEALAESRMMIVVLSPQALHSEHIAAEWQAYAEARRPVVPVVAEPCDLPGPLRTRRPINFTRSFSRAMHELTTRLLEYRTRSTRIDPVIWSLSSEVQTFRETHTPSPEPEANGSAAESSGLRRMVAVLRNRWKGADVG